MTAMIYSVAHVTIFSSDFATGTLFAVCAGTFEMEVMAGVAVENNANLTYYNNKMLKYTAIQQSGDPWDMCWE